MLIKFNTIKASEENNTQKNYEAGVYQVKIVNVEEKTSQSGNEYIKVTYETVGENVFKVFANYFPNSEKAVSILLNMLSAIGVYEEGKCLDDLKFEKDDLLGSYLELELVNGEENENGRSYLEVKPWSCKATEVVPF